MRKCHMFTIALLSLLLAGCGPEPLDMAASGTDGGELELEQRDGETGGEGMDHDRGAKPELPVEACCACNPGGTWTCEVWEGGPQACTDWGYENGVTVTWFPDCPAAQTDDPLDDVECFASCA